MPAKKRTWYAILGLLSWKPMSGYDIKKMIEMGLSHFWSESYGQLFPTLNRLVDERLATKRLDRRGGKRLRHVYTITRKGRRQFERWLHEPADIPRVRNELQLKFFLTSRLPAGESIRLLEEYRTQQNERLADYKESEVMLERAVRDKKLPPEVEEVLGSSDRSKGNISNEALVFLLTLRHGILAIEARLAWCEEALGRLRGQRRLS